MAFIVLCVSVMRFHSTPPLPPLPGGASYWCKVDLEECVVLRCHYTVGGNRLFSVRNLSDESECDQFGVFVVYHSVGRTFISVFISIIVLES